MELLQDPLDCRCWYKLFTTRIASFTAWIFLSCDAADTADAGGAQANIQRAAVLAAPAALGALITAALQALLIILVILAIILVLSKVVELVEDKIKEKEEEDRKKDDCKKTHDAYKALKCPSCTPNDTQAERTVKITCITALIAGRQKWLTDRCDYIMDGSIARGSAEAERGHKIQVEQELARLKKCQSMAVKP